MKVRAQLKSYEKLEFSITLHAAVEDWRLLLEQLSELRRAPSNTLAWPASGFESCIRQMLEDLDKTHADVLIREPEDAP